MPEVEEKVWTVRDCLDWTMGYLKRRGQDHPRLSAEWLLCAATGLERIDLYTHFDRPLSPEERTIMRTGVKRRADGEPLQYITGETSFRGHSILCAPEVLIPRPETEFLVDLVLTHLDERVIGHQEIERHRVELPWNASVEAARQAEVARQVESAAAREAERAGETLSQYGGGHETAAAVDAGEAATGSAVAGEGPDSSDDSACEAHEVQEGAEPPVSARVLEVGCGTGCVSLSLALERRGRVACVATDISRPAIDLALRNRERCGLAPDAVDIRFGDLICPVEESERGTFDVLVSNPPYIPTAVMGGLPHEVKDYEPHLALDGGPDGLAIFRRLLDAAPFVLKPGGLFACELFEGAVEDAAALCRGAGMVNVRAIEDLTRRPRFVFAEMPPRL